MKVYIAVFAAMALVAICSGFTLNKKSFPALRQTGGPLPLDDLSADGRRAFLGFSSGLFACELYMLDVYKQTGNDMANYAGKYEMQNFMNGITSALGNTADNDYIIQKLCWKFVPWSYAILDGTDNAQFVAGVEAKANIADDIECAGQLLHVEYWAKKFGTGFQQYFDADSRFDGMDGLCPDVNTLLNTLEGPFTDVDEDPNNKRQLRKLDDVLKQLQNLLQK